MVEPALEGGFPRAQDTRGCPSQVRECLGILAKQILIPESKRYPWMYIVHICPTQVGVRSTQAYKGTPQCGWLYLGEYLGIPENTRGILTF